MSKLKHIPYDKIIENFSKLRLTEKDINSFKKTKWVVTEKIHGANFCIITNGDEVLFAKRKSILSDDDEFFGYRSIKDQLILKVMRLYHTIQHEYGNMIQLSVYGELFGGEYPHPKVKKNPAYLPVQTGVYYSPEIEFSIFDIAYYNDEDKRLFLNYFHLSQFCKEADLMFNESLLLGKYEDAVAYKVGFKTTIPKKLGYPELNNIDNRAEGIVIKPVDHFTLSSLKG